MADFGWWGRLREVRFGRLALVYAGASWAVLEATGFFIDNFGFPQWLLRAELVLLAVGLVIVVATAIMQVYRNPPEPGEHLPAPWKMDVAGLGGSVRFRRWLHLTWARTLLGGFLAFSLLFAGAALHALLSRRSTTAESPDPQLVAIMPFRVTGDASLSYLGEGMIDLLAAKLSGEVGPRAADPRLVLNAWRREKGSEDALPTQDEALELARRVGARYALVGGIVGTPHGLVVNAELLGGARLVQADVEGPADSLTALVDHLAARLLLREAGEEGERLAVLTSTSLLALEAYINGQAKYRRGRYAEAMRDFQRAIEEDSSFALAGLGLASAAYWAVGIGAQWSEGLVSAWQNRERLTPRDRELLLAWLGPEYPAPPTWEDRLQGWERAIEGMPGRPEAWYEAGDVFFHLGAVLGIDAPFDRARGYFERALELDSAFVAPLSHLIEIGAATGDTARVRELSVRYAALGSSGGLDDYLHWRIAYALGDSAEVMTLRRQLPGMDLLSLRRILRSAQRDLVGLDAVGSALAALQAKTETRRATWGSLLDIHDVAANAGRPSEALRITTAQSEIQPIPRMHLRTRISDALYWDGDTTAAAAAVAELAAQLVEKSADSREEQGLRFQDLCVVEQWRLWHGVTDRAAATIQSLRKASTPVDSDTTVVYNRECAVLLEALLASLTSDSDADAAVGRLESMARAGPAYPYLGAYANLVLARLLDSRGDQRGALAAVRRLSYPSAPYLSTFRREEGRLAVLVGDREGAIRAFRGYLALRTNPEPSLTADVEAARGELERLLREGIGRSP
jgi:tetratricopeptide (TPR) repeat protein